MNIYKHLIRPTLFQLEAERAHDLAIDLAAQLTGASYVRSALSAYTNVPDARLTSQVAGMTLENPIGLAAGYDKSGRGVDGLSALGFGHIEVGSVSIDPSEGNPKPRLFRLPDDEAVIVHYGLQNDGAKVVSERLAARSTSCPVGVNIVKTNRGIDSAVDTCDTIITEYVDAVKMLHDCADYLTLNLSCPNTEDGRDFFADSGNVRMLMSALSELSIAKPVFLKVSPLGGIQAVEALLGAVEGLPFISGFIFNLAPGIHADLRTSSNMWTSLPGALAGRPVSELANQKIRELYGRMDRDRHRIIGVGGVSTAQDAYEKIKLGASLVQLLTALVYEGPWVVKRINEGLCELMERDGVSSVAEVVGVDAGKG